MTIAKPTREEGEIELSIDKEAFISVAFPSNVEIQTDSQSEKND